jgi:hypothetical protein
VPRLVALVGLVAGVALATGPAALWLLGGGAVPAGAAASEVPGSAVAAPGVVPAVLHDPAPPSAPVHPSAPAPFSRSPAPVPSPAPPPAPPVRVRVAAAGVDAPVVGTGVDAHGGMAVPHDVRTIGWYRFGAAPGAPAGSAVLAGHVDDHVQGHGAFHRLGRVAVGSRVEVVLADGTVLPYTVRRVDRVAKTALPAGQVFARDGPPRLALVTCGGEFDAATGGYRDNVVVTATQGTAP